MLVANVCGWKGVIIGRYYPPPTHLQLFHKKQPNLCLVSKGFGKASLLGSVNFKAHPLSIIDINFTVRFNYLKMNCWF